MARPLLPLLALALTAALLAPAAQAATPRVGYTFTGDPDDRGGTVSPGGARTYDFSINVQPATDDSEVTLEVAFSDFRSVYPASIAPQSQVSMRGAGDADYTVLGLVSGWTATLTRLHLAGGEYKVRVSSTLDPSVALGDHTSYLGFTARDPGTRTSTATASYPFTFHVQTPPNRAPTAAFTVSGTGLSRTFDATPSSDPDGDSLAYLWDFGDGGSGAGQTVSHTFAAGDHTVSLHVTDPAGLSDDFASSFAVGAATSSTSSTTPPSGGDTGGNTGSGSNTPVLVDSDGDGVSDSDEVAAGSNPHDRASVPSDRDGDGKLNESDNCPAASNADQADGDGDGIGDACDLNLADGPAADPDGDGKASSVDDCPAVANADQADLDQDGKGDVCDTDLDGDGAVNEADAFPANAAESADHDGDGTGDNADKDDDNDLVPDAEEKAAGSDPLDRHDPPWLASAATALRRSDGSNLVTWHAPADARLQRFLLWREASPYVLIATIPAVGSEGFEYTDAAPPAHARYHVQAQLDGMDALSYVGDDDRATNWVTAAGAVAEGCGAGAPDTDGDGLCDALESSMGLDPADADSDGDGLKDGDELLGLNGAPSIPSEADSDGDGISDSAERKAGTDPLGLSAATVEPKEGKGLPGWLWPTLIIAAAIVLAALILRSRRPQQPPQPPQP